MFVGGLPPDIDEGGSRYNVTRFGKNTNAERRVGSYSVARIVRRIVGIVGNTSELQISEEIPLKFESLSKFKLLSTNRSANRLSDL